MQFILMKFPADPKFLSLEFWMRGRIIKQISLKQPHKDKLFVFLKGWLDLGSALLDSNKKSDGIELI